ncbi:MAG TPA: rhodanese-like domain-containing protein [Dehalococcoidia bacterium]|nr:rhodanese-like domain-containing protein [Dehalococcoidia bacterium]
MIRKIDRDEVRRLVDDGAELIEVLTEGEYRQEHVVGAINLPLKKLNSQTAGFLGKATPIIVYCYDTD